MVLRMRLPLLALLALLAIPPSVIAATNSACPTVNMTSPPLDPTTQAFVDAGKGLSPIYTLPYAGARAFLENAQGGPVDPPAGIGRSILKLPVGPTGTVEVHLYKPQAKGGQLLPVIAYLHGGGWILGSPVTHQRLVADLITETGAAVFFVYYTPSPEAQYPVPIEQAYAAVQWLYGNGVSIGLDCRRLALAGDSVGGAMASAVTLLSIRRNTPLPKSLILFYPVTDISCESKTYREFSNGPGLVPETLRWMIDAFAPDAAVRSDDIASPLKAASKDLAKFPETLLVVAEVDPLREEGEMFARKLAANGVFVTVMRALGTVHDFLMLNPLANTPAARGVIELAGVKLRNAFA